MKVRHISFASLIAGTLLLACAVNSSPTNSVAPRPAEAKKLPFAHLYRNPSHVAARATWDARGAEAAAAVTPSIATEVASRAYPAFRPNAPQVVNQGGTNVLAHMEVVTITFNNDPIASAIEAFADGIGTTSDWAILREYGVGATKSGPKDHVRATLPGATVTDAQIQAIVQASVANPAQSGWPANTGDQLYAFIVPPDMFAIDNGDGTTSPWCQYSAGSAYHATTQATVGDAGTPVGLPIPYTILPQCSFLTSDWLTRVASHEYAEVATDPQVTTPAEVAYEGFDQAHLAYGFYQFLFASEVGDACEFFKESSFESPPPFTFNMQRLWSNRSARLGHNPCPPSISSEPYYNATTFADQLSTISVNWSGAALSQTCTLGGAFICPPTTQGIKVSLGESATFDIGFYSDAPTADWTVVTVTGPNLPIYDDNFNPISNGKVDVKIDRPTGSNGHRARVTVTPITAGAMGVEYIELQSGNTRLYEARTLPILIGQK